MDFFMKGNELLMIFKVESFQWRMPHLNSVMIQKKTLMPESPTTPTTSPVTLGPSRENLALRKIIKILLPKQLLQGLSILFAEVQIGNISKNLSNKIRKKCQSTVLRKSNFKKGIQIFSQISIKMRNGSMNSKSSRTSDAHMLRLNLTDKIDLQRSNNCTVFIKR